VKNCPDPPCASECRSERKVLFDYMCARSPHILLIEQRAEFHAHGEAIISRAPTSAQSRRAKRTLEVNRSIVPRFRIHETASHLAPGSGCRRFRRHSFVRTQCTRFAKVFVRKVDIQWITRAHNNSTQRSSITHPTVASGSAFLNAAARERVITSPWNQTGDQQLPSLLFPSSSTRGARRVRIISLVE